MSYTDGRWYAARRRREDGRLDQTLVVSSAITAKRSGSTHVRGHAAALYQETVHVPFVVRHPAITQRHVATLGAHPDITPTILDLLGLPADPRHQGVSLLRPHPPRFLPMFTDLTQTLMALRDGRWKLIVNLTQGRKELYDLAADPGETRNLAGERADLVKRFSAKLDAWASFQSDLVLNYQERVGEVARRMKKKATFLNELPPSKIDYDRRSPRLHGGTAGRAFVVAGEKFRRGIGMAANAMLRFDLDGRYRSLEGSVGRDGRARDGVVLGRIVVDGKIVFDSGPMKRATPPRAFKLKLDGAEELELHAVDADGNTLGDHVDWLGIRLR